MAQQPELQLHTAIHSRYQVFDSSGQFPFSIVFGLCRKSPEDIDPRSITLNTAGSALDVPYALAHKLLTLHQHNAETKTWTEVDLDGWMEPEGDGTCLTLSSPVTRREHWREAFTVYQYNVDANSTLASYLEPGKKYTIRLAGKDLGVKWYKYGESDHPGDSARSQPSEKAKLVNSKTSAGQATFKAVSSLLWPPKVLIDMRLWSGEAPTDDKEVQHDAQHLEMSFTNTGDEAISIQSHGHQRKILQPWGPFQPEETTDDSRPRVIDAAASSGISSLWITDTNTGAVVRPAGKPPLCGLYSPTDPRPKVSSMVTLRPAESLIRRMNIGTLLVKLPDGRYTVHLESRGAWWCFGASEEFIDESESDNRVPWRLFNAWIPPLTLETEDVVDLRIEGGRCIRAGA